jgi:multiple antibiotic resistance protein
MWSALQSDTAVYLKIFVALYVLVNPLEGIPVFLAKTHTLSATERAKIAYLAALGVTIILLVALFIGQGLLSLLGIGIGAFETAGGIIIFLIALQMISGKINEEPGMENNGTTLRRFALVPLATPLLAGPGPISSVILFASRGPNHHGSGPLEYLLLSGITVTVGLATWAALRAAERLRHLLGDTGIEVSTRISGILVAAIAVELIHHGLMVLLPGLVR